MKMTILQTAVTDYRAKFYSLIMSKLGTSFVLYGGESYFEASVISDPSIPYLKVRNVYFLGRRFLWQRGVLHLAKEEGVLVLEMNPRILSNWYLLLSRKRKKHPTVLWGHAWPRSGKDSKTDLLRHQMRKLADSIIVYTLEQKEELETRMPFKNIVAAPNALFYSADMQTLVRPDPLNLIYVGRLTKAKKPFFLVKAFARFIDKLPEKAQLVIVGAGEERESLEMYVGKHNLEKRVQLLGHISDYDQLRELYSHSLFSVSPGYVGLSITQSLGFGVPMLISKDEPHSPELEAVKQGENALFFETDSIDSFASRLTAIYKDREEWVDKRESIASHCRERYAVEAMVDKFINVKNQYGS